MQIRTNFLNYHTEYSAEGSIKHEMNRRACFGSISGSLCQYSGKLNQKYHIRIYNKPVLISKGNNNFLFVDVDKYLKLLNDFIPFDYTIDDEPDESRIVINLEIKNVPGIYHFFILTWIRPLYEMPYSFALHDALCLLESNDCPGLNIFDCFNLCLGVSDFNFGGGHSCITKHQLYKPMCIKEIYNSLKTLNMLNGIYKSIMDPIETLRIKKDYIILEDFINTYHRRHNKYVKNYKQIIKYV